MHAMGRSAETAESSCIHINMCSQETQIVKVWLYNRQVASAKASCDQDDVWLSSFFMIDAGRILYWLVNRTYYNVECIVADLITIFATDLIAADLIAVDMMTTLMTHHCLPLLPIEFEPHQLDTTVL